MSAVICARLRAAGLLDVAERAAKRAGLRLADCIAGPPEVTGGHRALWTVLALKGKTAREIGALLGWPEAAIAQELPAKAPPPPDSGPRVIGRAKALRPPRLTEPRVVVAAALPEGVPALLAALEERLEKLDRGAERLRSEAVAARRDLTSLRAALGGLDSAASVSARALAERCGVTPERLLSGSMQRDVCRARREIALAFQAQRHSQAEIGRMLNIGSSAVGQMLNRVACKRKAAA